MTESFPSRYLARRFASRASSGYPARYPVGFPAEHGVRQAAAQALRDASQALAQLASWLSAADIESDAAVSAAGNVYACPQLEFYAEAGAAEGALFIDGQLVGYVPGVTRL